MLLERRRMGWAVYLAVAACVGCGGPDANSPSSGKARVEKRTVTERMPDGSTRTTTYTTTHDVVPAAPPPPRPADPFPADPLVRHNVERINAYRAQQGLAPLLYDARISAFARAGSERLARDHVPHAHFRENARHSPPGFGSRSAENQGDPNGVPPLDADPAANGRKQVDLMQKMMMDEGPGGGHYDNMMSGELRRIGVGVFYSGGRLFLTNDFSD